MISLYEFFRPFLAAIGLLVLASIAGRELDAAMFRVFGFGRDSTDPASARSGLALFTDARTGCQYLGSSWGGLTPRLDSAGRQICGGGR